MVRIGASWRTRTADLLITNELLYQLSQGGLNLTLNINIKRKTIPFEDGFYDIVFLISD